MDRQVITIDAAQGRENNFVIMSCVRSNTRHDVGFLSQKKRTNVALTRGKHGLIILANVATLRNEPSWDALMSKLSSQIFNGVDSAITWIENRMKSRNELDEDFM